MELLSLRFAIFLGVLLVAYYAVGRLAGRGQWIVLLAASLFFYCTAGSPQTLVLLIITSMATWCAGLVLRRLDETCRKKRKATKDRKERRAIKARYTHFKRLALIAGLVLPLVILAYLKYYNVVLFNFGLAPTQTSLGLVLPLGISFYTFSALGYVIDCYNSNCSAERNPLKYLLFISYFPQLVQGPINKWEKTGASLTACRPAPDWHGMRRGALLLFFGIFKKFAIANCFTTLISKITYGIYPTIPGSVVVLGIFCYTIQMYCDFSGGIDMVEGVSELFGIEMTQNFRQPYLSVSLADYWRRWHMSLGAFMKDYIFYPIALTRPFQSFGRWCSKHMNRHIARTLPACFANIIVFLVVGLWHGAQLHYIAWGLYNGIVVALSDLLKPVYQKLNKLLHTDPASRPHHLFSVVRTLIVVAIGRYFDCIPGVQNIFIALRNTVTNFAPGEFMSSLTMLGVTSSAVTGGLLWLGLIAYLLVMVRDHYAEQGVDVRERVLSMNWILKGILYLFMCVCIAFGFFYLGLGGGFMYANF